MVGSEGQCTSIRGGQNQRRTGGDGPERSGRERIPTFRATAMSELSLLFFRKRPRRIIPPPVRKHGCPVGNGDIDSRREGENIYDDHRVAERRELEQPRQAPLTPQIVFGLVEVHL